MGLKCSKCGFESQDGAVFCAKCATRIPGTPTGIQGTGAGIRGTRTEFERIRNMSPNSVTKTLETTPEGLGKGKLFAGRFELIEELGAGGMGIVYRAYDKQVGEEIALKILHPEIALDERTVDRFRNEIKLARRISHRNVCRMHELHEDGKTLFITMEYVSGQDLKGLIRETKGLTAGKAISIAKQAAEGLCEAHSLGVIHRDLKPQNIMVDKEGSAKIMDFGIARSLRAAGMTAEGMIIGTPEYMAPEQVEGLEADQRTDIYAMGAILFEMVTGRVPFEGDSALSVAYKHKNEVPIPPRKLNAEIPEPFNKLILRCLEKQKDNRYQTAEELLADLIRIEEGLPISERVALPARPTVRIAREKPTGVRRVLIPALGILVLALAAFIALRVLPKKPPASPAAASGKPSIAVLNFENISGDPALGVWATGMTKLLSMGLQESKLIRVLDENSTYGILRQHKLDEVSKYTREDLVKIADEGGVSYTVSGSLMKAGESIIVMLTLQNPRSAEVANPIKVTWQNEAEILPKITELVSKIKSGMNLSPTQLDADAEEVKGLEKLTTSPEALKYDVESWRHFRNGDDAKGIALCLKAVELDPNFADVYVNLAAAYARLGNNARAGEYRNKAFELKDRLPVRYRLFVEGQYYSYLPGEDSKTKAIAAFEKYIEFEEANTYALDALLFLYRASGNKAKSLECIERGYRVEPEHGYWLTQLMVAYQQAGQLDRAEEVLKDHYEKYPVNPGIQKFSSQFYIVRKNFKQALAEIERGFLQDPAPEWSWDNLKGDVYLAQGDLAAAEKQYLGVIDRALKPKYVSDATYNLIRLDLLQGKLKRAADDLAKATAPGGPMQGMLSWGVACAWIRLHKYDRAMEIFETWLKNAREGQNPAGVRIPLLNIGAVHVAKGDLVEAAKIAQELKILGQKSQDWDAIVPYQSLQGLIDLEKGDYAAAVDNLIKTSGVYDSEEFSGVSSQANYFFPLASAYYGSGDLSKARATFEKLTNLTAGRWDSGDLYAKGFYWLGKIAEQQKDKARARENYRRFLDLWKDADPGFPEVDDARKRLADLGR
jgi:eukaryotic-like serine/threonine-protein kinase